MHEGRRREVGVGGFGYRVDGWEETHARVHEKNPKSAQFSDLIPLPKAKGGKIENNQLLNVL